MQIYIHKDVVGLRHHLLCTENGVQSVKDIVGKPLVYGEQEILEVSKIYSIDLPSFPSQNYVKTIKTVLRPQDRVEVPWKYIVPTNLYIQLVNEFGRELWETFNDLDLSYYQKIYRKTSALLDKMQKAKIDLIAFKMHSMSEDKSPHLESFSPDEDGFGKKVTYSKCDTKTGRLKVISGPNILNLHRNERNILTSRFGQDGKIWTLDYSSLEPRTILAIKSIWYSGAIFGSLPQDLYTHVLSELNLIGKVSREAVKEVIISQLYGHGHEGLVQKLEKEIDDAEGFISAVNDWFGIEPIKEKLLQEYENSDRKIIKSFYDRPIDASNAKPYMFLNYLAQPTAVDIALFGFDKIVSHIESNDDLQENIIPIFILHDALFLDIKKGYENHLKILAEIGSKKIPGFENFEFPLKPAPLL